MELARYRETARLRPKNRLPFFPFVGKAHNYTYLHTLQYGIGTMTIRADTSIFVIVIRSLNIIASNRREFILFNLQLQLFSILRRITYYVLRILPDTCALL